jgi:hypothetical protein
VADIPYIYLHKDSSQSTFMNSWLSVFNVSGLKVDYAF